MRTLRGAAAALAVTALAAGAHLAAGGRARPDVLVAVLLGAWVIAVALASRRIATGQLLGLLVLGQVVVHTVGSAEMSTGRDVAMLTAHLVGTAVSAWILRRGEDVLSGVADRLVLRFATPLAVGVPALVRVPAPAGAWTPPGCRRVHDVEERGPPVGAR